MAHNFLLKSHYLNFYVAGNWLISVKRWKVLWTLGNNLFSCLLPGSHLSTPRKNLSLRLAKKIRTNKPQLEMNFKPPFVFSAWQAANKWHILHQGAFFRGVKLMHTNFYWAIVLHFFSRLALAMFLKNRSNTFFFWGGGANVTNGICLYYMKQFFTYFNLVTKIIFYTGCFN